MFEDARGWIRRVPESAAGFKRGALIFTRQGFGRGLHLPVQDETRAIVVVRGNIIDYEGELAEYMPKGATRKIESDAPHGFLSMTDSLILYFSSEDYYDPKRIRFPDYVYQDWKFSEKDTPSLWEGQNQ